MTKDQAKQVLQMLLGAFPRHGLDDAGVRMWAESISRFDQNQAVQAARQFIQTDEFMPSIAKFASAVKRAETKKLNGQKRDDCQNPDGCGGWWLGTEERTEINGDGEVLAVHTVDVATPCRDCRADLYNRWKNGSLSKPTTG